MDLNISTMPFIIIVVYLITWFLKKKVFVTDEARKNLPPVAAAIGGGIALLLYFFAPDTMGYPSIVSALETGFGSGLAAVGCNQVYKQYRKFKDTSVDDGYGDDTNTTSPISITVSPVIDSGTTSNTSTATDVVNTPVVDDQAGTAVDETTTEEMPTYLSTEEEAAETAIEAESMNEAADDDRMGG